MPDDFDSYVLREQAAFWRLRAENLSAELDAAHERLKERAEAEKRAALAERQNDRLYRFAIEIAETIIGDNGRRPSYNAKYIQERAEELKVACHV